MRERIRINCRLIRIILQVAEVNGRTCFIPSIIPTDFILFQILHFDNGKGRPFGIFACPGEPYKGNKDNAEAGAVKHYLANKYVSNTGTGTWGSNDDRAKYASRLLTQIKNPSSTMHVLDGHRFTKSSCWETGIHMKKFINSATDSDGALALGEVNYGKAYRHSSKRGLNTLMVDGHAKPTLAKDIPTGFDKTGGKFWIGVK